MILEVPELYPSASANRKILMVKVRLEDVDELLETSRFDKETWTQLCGALAGLKDAMHVTELVDTAGHIDGQVIR